MKYKAFLSLGSNIGDKEKNLETGIDFLTENNNVELINSSRIYETEPIYNKNQEKFCEFQKKSCETVDTALDFFCIGYLY